MTARRLLTPALVVVAVVVIAVLALGGGSKPYVVKLQLQNANGLRKGSDVRLGGATVGTVGSVELGDHDAVNIKLNLTKGNAKVGQGATASIRSTNLLGDKFVQLDAGDLSKPASSGLLIPAAKVTAPVDLDQVLDVMDSDTRARLQILINEAGKALSGRSVDFSALLQRLPGTLDSATAVVDRLAKDNKALGNLIDHSDSFLTELTPQRQALGDLVDEAGQAMQGTADRRENLKATIARAPGTLRSAQNFLAELQRTTVPLGPAAQAITASAPPLSDALAEIPGFTKAAKPTLEQARRDAPLLTNLAVKATPVVTRTVPTFKSLLTLLQTTPDLLKALDNPDGIDGILSALEGWGRATQGRDGVGHVFRGHIAINADIIASLTKRVVGFLPAAKDKQKKSAGTESKPTIPVTVPKLPKVNTDGLGKVTKDLQGVLDGVTKNVVPKVTKNLPPAVQKDLKDLLSGGKSNDTSASPSGAQSNQLLDFLLGK